MTDLLKVEQLEVVYHKVATAVQGVSFVVPEKQIVAIVGTNGAGKTTTLRSVSGFLPSEDIAITNGEISFCGKSLLGAAPHQVAKLGIAIIPEREKIFQTMTVQDNLAMVPSSSRQGIGTDDIYGYFPRLLERRNQIAGYMSGGEKQMLAISMAMLNNPRLLIIDELSLGLAPIVVKDLMLILKRLNREIGMTILLVEQNAMAALDIADYAYVMENGRIVHDGLAADLKEHGDIREFYLGGNELDSSSNYRNVKQYSRKRRWWG